MSIDTPSPLGTRLHGTVTYPQDPGWDEARAAWNLAVDQHPHSVVAVADADDVSLTLRHAAASGLRVAPQGTGHLAAPLGDLDDTILLHTGALRGVTVDPEARTARVEAGAVWADVVAAVAPHGLTALSGSSHDVGVTGYCLGGGLSWLAREHGLACNAVQALEVVTADGISRRVDETAHPELYWALRGGGGSFAVVTALELALFPVTEVYAGALFWPMERAGDVLHAYREWTEGLPDAVTSCGRLLNVPPLEEIPEFLRSRSFVVVEAVADLPEAEAVELLAPLRALAPEMDTCATIPTSALLELHMDPPGPVPGTGTGAVLASLTEQTVDAMVAVAGPGSGSPLLSLEIRHLGGALARSERAHGALSRLEGEFALFGVGISPTTEAVTAVDAALDAVLDTLRPWLADRVYANFLERPSAGPAAFHTAETVDRLRLVKARFDGDDLIRAAHPVHPSTD